MKSEYLEVNGLRIAYCIHSPEQEYTIFFIHGNSSSAKAWRKQVTSPLLADYRLITIDLPSHGNSDELPVDADFSLPAIAKIAGAAINQLISNKPFILCGSSLGTNIVVEMLSAEISPNGIILAGPCIVGEGFGLDKMILPTVDVTPVFAENVPINFVNKYAGETSASIDIHDRIFFLEDYNAVKGLFRSSLYNTIAAGNYNDEIVLLQKNNCPVCLVFGREEKVVNTNYLDGASINLWNKTIYKIPGASHLVQIDQADGFNSILHEFANDIFK